MYICYRKCSYNCSVVCEWESHTENRGFNIFSAVSLSESQEKWRTRQGEILRTVGVFLRQRRVREWGWRGGREGGGEEGGGGGRKAQKHSGVPVQEAKVSTERVAQGGLSVSCLELNGCMYST